MTPSLQQQAILDEIASGAGSIIVEARAGSGKTTVLQMIAEALPQGQLVSALAFNKQNATTFEERFPAGIQCGTFHSKGFRALQRHLPSRPKVDGNKTFGLAKDQLTRTEFDTYFKFSSKLVGYAKNAGIATVLLDDTVANWMLLVDHYNLILDSTNGDESEGIAIARRLLAASNAKRTVVDFDDMLYLALLLNVVFDKNNYLLVDEAQDTNGVQRALLHRMLATPPYGRLIAVGDPAQSIYGFRGADADAIDALQREFNAKVMPLSVSYRCSKAVVQHAKQLVSQIEPSDFAPEGSVETTFEYDIDTFNPQDVILCRVVAPIVSMAFGFIRRNVGVRILGREIGVGLVTLIKKMNTRDLDTLEQKLGIWADREMAKARSRGHDSAASQIEDKFQCLQVFIHALREDERNVDALCNRITALFTDNNKGLLTLCSVHKAKGLEWNTVYLLDESKYMPSKYATQDWQLVQEHNLRYVAYTRAKLDLRFITSGTWKQPTVQDRTDPQPILTPVKTAEDFLAEL